MLKRVEEVEAWTFRLRIALTILYLIDTPV